MDHFDDCIEVPIEHAMLLALTVGPVADDVTASPDARAFALAVRHTPLMFAYHWACHHYLRACPWNIWHGD